MFKIKVFNFDTFQPELNLLQIVNRTSDSIARCSKGFSIASERIFEHVVKACRTLNICEAIGMQLSYGSEEYLTRRNKPLQLFLEGSSAILDATE